MEETAGLYIPGRLPGLNEILDARMERDTSGRYTKKWNAYSDMKESWTGHISIIAAHQKFLAVEGGFFTYVWWEPNKMRDPSNFTAGGRKLIEDALQGCNRLRGDGWKHVKGFTDCWFVDKHDPFVCVFVHPQRVLTDEEAWSLSVNLRNKHAQSSRPNRART